MPPRAGLRGDPRHSSSKGETREESQSMWSPFSQSGATVAAGEECDDGCSVSKLESKTCTTVVEGLCFLYFSSLGASYTLMGVRVGGASARMKMPVAGSEIVTSTMASATPLVST